MTSKSLIQWGGLSAVFGGATLVIQQVYSLVSSDVTSGGWIATHVLGYIGLAYGLLGQVAIYAFQQEKFSKLGTTGFILGFLGNALTVGAAFMNTFIVPVITVSNPDLLSPTGPLFMGPLGILLFVASLLVTIGFILFGSAIAQAGVLPSFPAWLVVVSSWFGVAAVFSPMIFLILGIIFGFANAWLGWVVWSSKSS